MASEAVLDFDVLVAPLAGDNPAGAPLAYTIRQKLDAARKEFEPDPDDPSGAPVPRKPDWSGLVKQCSDLLAKSCKDLVVAARLVEALARRTDKDKDGLRGGFRGLRDGLRLLVLLVEQAWDRLYPVPDEEEGIEVRGGPFLWLSDPESGARFPHSVRGLPVVAVGGNPYSWLDWKIAQTGKRPAEGEAAAPAVGPSEQDFARADLLNNHIAEDLEQALAELTKLEHVLQEKMAEHTPSLVELRQAMEDAQGLLKQVLRRLQPAMEQAAQAEEGAQGNGEAALSGSMPTVGTRDEAYRQLANIASILERIEPHSPIPDLLRRAIELGRMPFRQLINELIREPSLLAELRREFGIREAGEGS